MNKFFLFIKKIRPEKSDQIPKLDMESAFQSPYYDLIMKMEQNSFVNLMMNSDQREKYNQFGWESLWERVREHYDDQKYKLVMNEWKKICEETGRCVECGTINCQHRVKSISEQVQPDVTTLAKALKERLRNSKDDLYWFFLTFTQNEDFNLTEEQFHNRIMKMVGRARHFEYTLEHHESGKLHCHLLCAYEKSHVPKTDYFKEKWRLRKESKGNKIKIGNIDGQIINFNRNPNSIESIKKYISKENPPVLKVDYTQPSIVYPDLNASKKNATQKKGLQTKTTNTKK